MANGFLFLYRSLSEHRLWHKRPFSDGQAWIDLLFLAAWQKHRIKMSITVERGQLWTTLRYLGERWGWSKNRVARFIGELEADFMVSVKRDTKRDTGGTLITIINYNEYQQLQESAQTRGTQTGQEAGHKRDTNGTQTGLSEEGKKVKEEKKTTTAGLSRAFHCEEFKAAWETYVQHRAEIRKPLKPTGIAAAHKKLQVWGLQKAIQAIENSIANGWQGLFEPGENRGNNRPNPERPGFHSGEFAKDAAALRARAVKITAEDCIGCEYPPGMGPDDTQDAIRPIASDDVPV